MPIHYPLREESIEEINKQFYSHYDTEHWFFKIKTYEMLLDNTEEFVEEFGDEEMQEKSIDSFHQAIESEIVFTFYHSAESLFMLMTVCEGELPWLQMKHVRVSDIADLVRDIIIEQEWDDGELKQLFYPGATEHEGDESLINDSLEFIEEYLARMGERWLDNDIYNEYKHGLRLSTGTAQIQLTPENSDGEENPPILEREGTTHTYLDDEEVEREGSGVYHQISRVKSGFDYELYLQLCYLNYNLIDQIIQIRKARLDFEGEGETEVRSVSFDHLDIEDMFDYDAEKDWEFSVSYPAGDVLLTIG